MTAVGFPVTSDSVFNHYLAINQFNGQVIELGAGCYRRLADGAGVELWLEENGQGNPTQMNPHFAGATRMRVRIVNRLVTPRGETVNNAFAAWADPEGEHDDQPGAYPFVFDSPDFHLYDAMELPLIEEVQIAIFAEDVRVYRNEEEFRAADETGPLPLAVESFVPLDRLMAQGSLTFAYAKISGHVMETRIIENLLTPESFCWARLRTYGGEVDMVADPALLERLPVAGDIVFGYFWISGRIPGRYADETAREDATDEAEPKLETPDDYYQRAQYYAWSRHKYEKAIELLKEATRLDPGFTLGYFLMGNVYQQVDEYEPAIEAFEKVLKINPRDSGAYSNLASAYQQLDRHEESLAIIGRWLQAEPDREPPDFSDAYYSMATAYAGMGRVEEAEKICREKITEEKRGHYLGSLGSNFSWNGRHEDGIRLLEEALSMAPEDKHANFDLGWAYIRAGDRDAAMRQYEILLGIDEEWARALLDKMEPVH
jgi:tetratricopeptide (TPR) repeat protein